MRISKNGCSPSLPLPICNPCACDYVPQSVEYVLMKITKKGNIKIKVNGKGKWIGATYDPISKTLSFSA